MAMLISALMAASSPASSPPDSAPMAPAMAAQVEQCLNRGVIARFAETIRMERVAMDGVTGERIDAFDVQNVIDQP